MYLGLVGPLSTKGQFDIVKGPMIDYDANFAVNNY